MGFSPIFSLLKPTFSLLPRPRLLTLTLPTTTERSPTNQYFPLNSQPLYLSIGVEEEYQFHSFGVWLSPVHFRRRKT